LSEEYFSEEYFYPATKEGVEMIDSELRGKYQLLIAGTAWELYTREKRYNLENIVSLELELEGIVEKIKELKRQLRKIIKINPSLKDLVRWSLWGKKSVLA